MNKPQRLFNVPRQLGQILGENEKMDFLIQRPFSSIIFILAEEVKQYKEPILEPRMLSSE